MDLIWDAYIYRLHPNQHRYNNRARINLPNWCRYRNGNFDLRTRNCQTRRSIARKPSVFHLKRDGQFSSNGFVNCGSINDLVHSTNSRNQVKTQSTSELDRSNSIQHYFLETEQSHQPKLFPVNNQAADQSIYAVCFV